MAMAPSWQACAQRPQPLHFDSSILIICRFMSFSSCNSVKNIAYSDLMSPLYLQQLFRCPLFDGLSPADIETMLPCLSPRKKKYEKDAFIFTEGDEVTSVGIVLSGAVHILREDLWGDRTILMRLGPGKLFAEAFACAGGSGGGAPKLEVSVEAAEKTEALFISFEKIIGVCKSACSFHNALVGNLISALARRNIMLMHKMEHITKKTTREKLLSYLSARARQNKSNEFEIPFNRQELADYLSVERSAMSAELSRMRREGLIDYRKNWFRVK
jgi:CRP-like cAMP-binding protein